MDPLRSPSRGSMAESPSKRKLKEENPTLYTLNKLKTFFDHHAFDTEGPYADLFSVLLSTCRHLIDVNISQTLRNKKHEGELAALNGEMGALSVFAAEQIKEEDERLQQRRSSASRGSFLFQKLDGNPKAPSLTASALGEEARSSPAPRGGSVVEAAGAEGEAAGADYPSYTLHKTLYSVLKNKIAEQAASHHRLLEHVQWMTPQIARLEEQQLEILKQLDAVRETLHQTNVTVRRASSVANSPSAAAAAARRASAVLRENEERQHAAAAAGTPGTAAALTEQIHALGDGLRTCEAELRVLRGALQRGNRGASLPGAAEDAAEAQDGTRNSNSMGGGGGALAFVTREELAACLKERDRNINWALLDVQEEVERRGEGDDVEVDAAEEPEEEEEGERGRSASAARRQRGSVQIAAATGFAPSQLATDLSRKLQLILYTVAEKQIEKNVAYLLLRQNEERHADIESRLEVLEVYSPHQRQVAVRPPLLGVELEDFTLTYNNNSNDKQQAVATAQQVRGVRVKKVYGNYPAAAAGLAADDVIVGVASEEVHSRADLYSVLLELSQQYRCRCQLLMERAFLKETMLQVGEEEAAEEAKKKKEDEDDEEARQLRGYRAFSPFLPAQGGEAAESVRAQQLRQALPRFELPMTILRNEEFYNISVLIPSSMALNPSDE